MAGAVFCGIGEGAGVACMILLAADVAFGVDFEVAFLGLEAAFPGFEVAFLGLEVAFPGFEVVFLGLEVVFLGFGVAVFLFEAFFADDCLNCTFMEQGFVDTLANLIKILSPGERVSPETFSIWY